MNDVILWLLAGSWGALLGALFFGGLWWTVEKGLDSPFAAVWFLGSFLARTATTLAGFYFLTLWGDWTNLIAGLIGFVISRSVVTRVLRRKEERHAPDLR